MYSLDQEALVTPQPTERDQEPDHDFSQLGTATENQDDRTDNNEGTDLLSEQEPQPRQQPREETKKATEEGKRRKGRPVGSKNKPKGGKTAKFLEARDKVPIKLPGTKTKAKAKQTAVVTEALESAAAEVSEAFKRQLEEEMRAKLQAEQERVNAEQRQRAREVFSSSKQGGNTAKQQ